jgi:hypothetical protein
MTTQFSPLEFRCQPLAGAQEGPLWRNSDSRSWLELPIIRSMREGVLKIAALFSYCGGPLFIADLLKPRHSTVAAFWITFLPVGFMAIGALCLDDDTRSRWSRVVVRAGRTGLFLVLGMHLYAIWCFVNGVHVPDQALHYMGIAIGLAWSFAYLRASRRWISSTGGLSYAGGTPSTEPIEPS